VVFGLEQSGLDESVEVEGRERSAYLRGGRSLVAIDGHRPPGHVLIQPTPDRLGEQGDGVHGVGRTVIHRWNCIACTRSRKT
jgi:hypothetical protein